MLNLNNIKKILSENKPYLQDQFKVKDIGIFGSFVREEQKENSDIDILVEFSEPIGFFAFLDLEEYLTKLLGIKVDLVSKKALKPILGNYILQELIPV